MVQGDFEEFVVVLKQLSEAFGKKLTDELTQAYWKALRDLTLPIVTRMADSHLRYGKFWPKPSELRPKDAPPERKPDPAFEAAVAQNIENWEQRIRADPIGGRRLLFQAYAARTDIAEKPGTLAHEERLAFIRDAAKRIDAMERAYGA
jgi:hypothetical protein